MIQIPHITFAVVAGPLDPALWIVVPGTIAIALIAHVLALVGWLRRR
jgi:hypothetical protein